MSALGNLDRAGRPRSPATMPGYHAGRPPANKGKALPGRSAARRGDRRRDAPGRREQLRAPPARDDRRALACRSSNPRGARARGDRSGGAPRRHPRPPRQGRQAARSRHGRLGLGTAAALAVSSSHDAGRAALLRDRRPFGRAAVDGQRRPFPASAARRRSWRPPPLCPSPVAPRSRDRDGRRGRSAQHHPAPAGPHRSRRTSTYLQGIDNAEIINAVHARRAPMMPASAGLRL